jgi:hypothetical protein
MSDRNTKPLFDYVARRAKRNFHFRKLRGREAKPAVIIGAAARLLTPGKLVKLPPKPGKPVRWRLVPVELVELLPKPLKQKMLPSSIGNIQLYKPTDAPIWIALTKVYMQLFELSPIWGVKGAARVELVDNAIDASFKQYVKETEVGGGEEELDPTTHDALGRYTEAGQAYAMEPTRNLDKWESLGAEDAVLEYRKQIEADENAKLQRAVEAYARTLLVPAHLAALKLICSDPQLPNSAVGARVSLHRARGIAPSKVKSIRAQVEKLADKVLTLPPEEGSSEVEASPAAVPHDETLTQIAEALHSNAALDLAAIFQAPDVDAADISENILRNYARSNSTSAFMRDNWSGGRRRYSDVELVTGSRYGGRWADPAKIALRDERKQHANKFSDVEMRELREKAVAADFAINRFLRAIDSFIRKRAAKSVDDMMASTIVQKPNT